MVTPRETSLFPNFYAVLKGSFYKKAAKNLAQFKKILPYLVNDCKQSVLFSIGRRLLGTEDLMTETGRCVMVKYNKNIIAQNEEAKGA